LGVNLARLPFGDPERQLARSEAVAAQIASSAGGDRFGIWLLADDDSEGAYRFLLERIGRPAALPSESPPRLLFVICQAKPCGAGDVFDAIGPDWIGGRIDWTSDVSGVGVVRVVAP
jgi:hypothetical protein